MNIYTIFTGGTIGSRLNTDGLIAPNTAVSYRLIEQYNRIYPNQIRFFPVEPYHILSENLCAANLCALASSVQTILSGADADGIIITHGTDTLQYTAAILSYLFGDSKIPILLVSSDFVLSDPRANGQTNFHYAVQFIKERRGTGVFVSYCNAGQFPTIHYGTRLQNPLTYSADVYSIADSWYGRYMDGTYMENPRLSEYRQTNPSFDSRQKLPIDCSDLQLTEYSDSVLRIRPYVGMRYPSIPEHTQAILHESYHSGTIRTGEDLKQFCQNARELRIPVYLVGLTQKEAEYETVETCRAYGIQPLPDTAVIAQYCKLWIAASNRLDIPSIMSSPAANDHVFYSRPRVLPSGN